MLQGHGKQVFIALKHGTFNRKLKNSREIDKLIRSSRAIYQRCGRLCDVVTVDMERFEPGMFTDRVLGSVRVLRREIMPVFSRRVSEMIRVLD